MPRFQLPGAARTGGSASLARRALIVICALGLVSGLAGGTGASLNATNVDDGGVAAPALAGPGGTLTATPAGNNVQIAYSGTTLDAEAQAYEVMVAAANGTSCTGATGFTPLTSTTTSPVTDSTTVNTPSAASQAGNWYCYQLRSGYWPGGTVTGAPTWTSQVSPGQQAVQAGFTPDAAHLPHLTTLTGLTTPNTQGVVSAGGPVLKLMSGANNNIDGTIAVGTTWDVIFSSATNQPTLTGTICLSGGATKTLYIDDPFPLNSTAACNPYDFMKVSGMGVSGAGPNDRFTATYAWVSSSDLQITITGNARNGDKLAGTATPPCDGSAGHPLCTLASSANAVALVDAGSTQFTFNFASPTLAPAYSQSGYVCVDTSGASPAIVLGDLSPSGACGSATVELGTLVPDTSQAPAGTVTYIDPTTAAPTAACNGGRNRLSANYQWNSAQTQLVVTVTNVNAGGVGCNAIDIAGNWKVSSFASAQPVGNTAAVGFYQGTTTFYAVQIQSQFQFHFNQPTSQPAISNTGLCEAVSGGKADIYFGDPVTSGTAACGANSAGYLESTTAGNLSPAGPSRLALTYAWTSSQLLTVTVAGFPSTASAFSTAAPTTGWKFYGSVQPTGGVIQSATGAVYICNNAVPLNAGCVPVAS